MLKLQQCAPTWGTATSLRLQSLLPQPVPHASVVVSPYPPVMFGMPGVLNFGNL